jgi:hypothetical protein
MLGCDNDLALTPAARADSKLDTPFSTCSLLTEDEWEALLGPLFHGPEQKDSWYASGEIFTSRCAYNFTRVSLTRPAAVSDVDELHADLETYLKGLAEEDAERGFDWTVHVESVDGLGVPAVVGEVTDSDPEGLGLGMVYLRALAGAGDERILLKVDSGEDATQATKVAARILAAL